MSAMESASLIPPSAVRAISSTASFWAVTPREDSISLKCAAMSEVEILRKLKRWQRESMVAGSLCTSVVAKMNSACSGGSSRVFSSALNAPPESMCTSSII